MIPSPRLMRPDSPHLIGRVTGPPPMILFIAYAIRQRQQLIHLLFNIDINHIIRSNSRIRQVEYINVLYDLVRLFYQEIAKSGIIMWARFVRMSKTRRMVVSSRTEVFAICYTSLCAKNLNRQLYCTTVRRNNENLGHKNLEMVVARLQTIYVTVYNHLQKGQSNIPANKLRDYRDARVISLISKIRYFYCLTPWQIARHQNSMKEKGIIQPASATKQWWQCSQPAQRVRMAK